MMLHWSLILTCIAVGVIAGNNEGNSDESGDASPSQGPLYTCDCGRSNKFRNLRIINGSDASESEYPFMVGLRRQTSSLTYCGASIITPMHIMTAAHCVSSHLTKPQPDPSVIRAAVGAHHTTQESSHGYQKIVTAKEIRIPQEWFSSPSGVLDGDIAIIVLNEPLMFNPYVNPVCLSPTALPIVDTYIEEIGWGAIDLNQTQPDILQKSQVLVVDKTKCHNKTTEICFKTGPTTSCYGDSGGPFIYHDPSTNRYVLAGLASYVYNECKGALMVATNPVFWYDWIHKIVQETSKYDVCRRT